MKPVDIVILAAGTEMTTDACDSPSRSIFTMPEAGGAKG